LELMSEPVQLVVKALIDAQQLALEVCEEVMANFNLEVVGHDEACLVKAFKNPVQYDLYFASGAVVCLVVTFSAVKFTQFDKGKEGISFHQRVIDWLYTDGPWRLLDIGFLKHIGISWLK